MTTDPQAGERLARINYETEQDGIKGLTWDELPWRTRERKMQGIDAVLDALSAEAEQSNNETVMVLGVDMDGDIAYFEDDVEGGVIAAWLRTKKDTGRRPVGDRITVQPATVPERRAQIVRMVDAVRRLDDAG